MRYDVKILALSHLVVYLFAVTYRLELNQVFDSFLVVQLGITRLVLIH